ncbi:MAG: DUF362 domain-containing protein [Candidatus Thermoplasmatota archaeon]|nr:DUF362 domain-containing protein [Candidatus Thermoplasmatota archaeon]
MNKVVFFSDLKHLDDALNFFNVKSFSGKTVPVKLHMGELKNKHFISPDFTKIVVDALRKIGAKPYLFDTTVSYSGKRHTVEGYLEVARIHGFTSENIGCDIVIDDKGIPVDIEGREYEVAEHIFRANYIFGLTHVKGHVATGMGGAIKNFGMGGVTKKTKRKMHHGSRPVYEKDACTFCGVCAEVCPFDAIRVKQDSWNQNMDKCFGCGVCVDLCKTGALKHVDAEIQYLLACAAKACVFGKNVIYLNELKHIAKSCDCDPSADPIICPDIGYLVSDDPVAIDKASLDLIFEVKGNVFEKENKISPFKQIKFGEEIGLGSSSYKLIEL